jgi:hypothetical protein
VIATANSQTAIGVEGELVEVEARVSGREHGATIIVGLPDRAVTEARERVRAGVIASELWWPQGRVVVNLAPGNVPKLGPRHDLAMAVAILAASDQLPRARADKVLVLGELAFDGRLRPGLLRGVRARVAPESGSQTRRPLQSPDVRRPRTRSGYIQRARGFVPLRFPLSISLVGNGREGGGGISRRLAGCAGRISSLSWSRPGPRARLPLVRSFAASLER